jgi:hypothetical protein
MERHHSSRVQTLAGQAPPSARSCEVLESLSKTLRSYCGYSLNTFSWDDDSDSATLYVWNATLMAAKETEEPFSRKQAR